MYSISTELLGREYKFGTHDCFEAVRNFYKLELAIDIPPRGAFEEFWWKKGINYFTEERLNEWGFQKVEVPKQFDVLLFSISSKVPNHCGVYLGENTFYHHARNRLSCRDSLTKLWATNITGTYTYA